MSFYQIKVSQRVEQCFFNYTNWYNSFGGFIYEINYNQIQFVFDALGNIINFAKADKNTPLDNFESLFNLIVKIPSFNNKKIIIDGLTLDTFLYMRLMRLALKHDMMKTFWKLYENSCNYAREDVYTALTPELQTAASIMG